MIVKAEVNLVLVAVVEALVAALAEALAAGLITRETALEYAENPDAVEKGSARAQESTEKKYSW